MQLRLFFPSSKSAAERLTEIFTFVWPTAAAIWNLRWQVAGIVGAAPDIKEEELLGRFVTGSGLRGANLRRACIETSWEDQKQQFSKFLLFEFCALYEYWCDTFLSDTGQSRTLAKHLQFQTTSQGNRQSGIGHARASMQVTQSPAMVSAFSHELSKNRKYSPNNIENLLICYRYFKEARNSLIHNGGTVDSKMVTAQTAYSRLTAVSLGVKEAPEFHLASAGDRVLLNLRGVVGFGDIVLRLVSTLDIELAKTTSAEQSLRKRWVDRHGKHPCQTGEKNRRIKILTRQLGLPTPVTSAEYKLWLRQERLVF